MPRRAAWLALLVVWAIGATSARAATFGVTTTADSGDGSLRKAVADANASADATNTIAFASSLAGQTIALATPLDALANGTLILDATAAPGLRIDGGGTTFLENTGTSTALRFQDLSYTNGSATFLSLDVLPYDLTLSESGSGEIDGGLTGDLVVLTKTGAGTTTLTAGNTIDLTGLFNGSEFRVEQGTFDVAGTLTVATLSVAPAGALIVGGDIAVTNHLDSLGSLTVNGSLSAGTLLIGPAGSLLGDTGSVFADTTVQGRVAPSGAAGAIAFTGPVSFADGSVLDVDVQPGSSDQLDVTGTVTIDPGARVEFQTDASEFAASESFTLLQSNAPIDGSFTLGTDYAFLTETLVTAGNVVQLTLAPASFAFTPNQQRVAAALDAASVGATGDLADALDAIDRSATAEIPGLYDAIGGESLTAFATARQILAERTSRALHRRVRDPAWGSGRAVYSSATTAQTADVAAAGDEEHEQVTRPSAVRAGAWLDVLGLYGELDGETGEAEVETLLYGGTFGADATIADRFVVGLAAGYARSDVELEDRDADVFGDTVQGALYAGFVDPRGYLSAYGRYAYTFETSRREIASTTLARRATARFDAQDYGAGGELGVTVLSLGGVSLQPIAGIDWLRMDEESYTERGAGDLSLIVDPEPLESTTTRLGGRLFAHLEMDRAGTLVPELRAFYQQLSGDRERVLDARLAGAPGLGSIGVRGAELPRESLLLGVGWGVLLEQTLAMSLEYDALLGSDRVEHQATITARLLF